MLLLVSLFGGGSSAWADDVTLFTTNFTESAWNDVVTTSESNSTNVTIYGTTVTLKGYYAGNASNPAKGFSVNTTDGVLSTPGMNMKEGNYYIKIPISNINGSIKISVSHNYSTKQPKFNYAVVQNGEFATADIQQTASSSNGANSVATISNLTYTDGYVYIGQNSSSYPEITGITITTPGPSLPDVGTIKSGTAPNVTWNFANITSEQVSLMSNAELGTWTISDGVAKSPAVTEATYWSPSWCEGIQLGLNQNTGVSNNTDKARVNVYTNTSPGFYLNGGAASMKVKIPEGANTLTVTASNELASNTSGVTFSPGTNPNTYVATVTPNSTIEIHRKNSSGMYISKVETSFVEPVAGPTATFLYGANATTGTQWISPDENEMTITIPAHKAGQTFNVTVTPDDGATIGTINGGSKNGNIVSFTAPSAGGSPLTVTIPVTKDAVTTNYTIRVNTETALNKVTFDENTRYSKLIIDNNYSNFYANTTASGINSNTGSLDYVPGLVAKAMIEAVDYYKDHTNSDITADKVKSWYEAVKGYGNNHSLKSSNGTSLDDQNAVKLYFTLKKLASSSDANYADATTVTKANDRINASLGSLKKTNEEYVIGNSFQSDMEGGWWHKSTYNNQMWCDGQYMGTALLAQMLNDDKYSTYTHLSSDDWAIVYKQLDITYKYLYNTETKLLHHAFAADNGTNNTSSMWSFDKKNGQNNYRNSAVWGRAAGWYFLALVDVLEQMQIAGKTSTADYTRIKGYLSNVAAGLKARQDATTGCWYQLPMYDDTFSANDCGNGKTENRVYNYLESSATAIYTAAYLKGIRLGFLDKATYETTAKKAYQGFVENFINSTDYKIYWCSRSAGIGTETSGTNLRTGSDAYYLRGYDVTPTKITDPDNITTKNEFGKTTPRGTEGKALGAFIMAATEYERAYLEDVVKQDITRLSPKGGTNTTKIAVNQIVNPYLFIAPFTSDKKILTVDDFEITSTDNSIVTGAIRNNTIYNNIENNDCRHLVLDVTGVAVGSATITVHFKGNDEYNPYDWSCVYTVAETRTVASTNDGNGTVKITSKDAEVTSVLDGTQVTYTAIPNDGYIFAGWVDNSTEKYLPEHANDNPLKITVTADTNLKATFTEARTFNVAYATGSDATMGSIAIYERNTNTPNLNGVAVPQNMNLDFVANPNDGYKFVGWYEEAECTSLVSSDVKFLKKAQDIATNTTYYAKFEQKATETLFNLVVSSETTETVTADTPIDITLGTFASTLEGGTATAGTLSGSYEAVNANDYLKFGANAQYVKIDLTKPLAAGDVIEFTSYGGNNKQLTFTTDNKRATANLTSDGKYIVPAGSNLVGATTLYVWRAESSTTYVSSLKITRPAVTLDAVIKIDNIIQAKTETSGDGSSDSSRETYEYEVPGDYEGATVPVAISTSGTVSEAITSLATPVYGTPTVKDFTITAGETVKYFRITLTRGKSSKSEILGATINGTAAVINENTISQLIPFGGATTVPVSLTLPAGATASPTVPFNMTLDAAAGATASQEVTVTAQDGVSQTVYTVNLTRGKNDVLMVTYDGQEYMLLKENAYKTDGTTKYVEGSETAAAYFQATDNWSSVTIDNQSLNLMNQSGSGRYLTLNTNGALSFEVITQIGNTSRHNVVEVDYDGDGTYEYKKTFGATVSGLTSSGLLPATNTGSILSSNVKIKISGTDGSVYPFKVIFYTTKKAKKSVTLEYSAAEWDGSNSQPTLTAKDEDGNTLTIGTDINVTYTTDDPNVAEVEDNGNVTIADAANGNAVITATSAENEIYNAASDHFVVKKQQGVTFAFSENSTKPIVREHIFLYGDETSEMGDDPTEGKKVLLTGTFGGWNRNEGKYNPADLSDKTSYKADDWAAVAGAMNPVDGYEWASTVNRDAADEACNKESYYGKDRAGWFQPADVEDGRVVESYPFTLPVRGGYMTFEPTVNGTLTIYIDQNGAWDNDGGGKDNFLGHFRKHAFFITDQNGVSVSNYTDFSTITKTPVTQGDENDKKFTCNLDANGNAADEDPYNIGNWDEFKNYFTRSERLAVKNAWNTGVNGAQQVIKLDNGSFLVTQRAAVKYTFYVSAGQTYYLFSNFSKMGFCAVNFVADTETGSQPTATLALKEKEPYVKPTLYETTGQENNVKNISVPQYQQISLDRTFKADTWNTIYLPFVMTEKEVRDVFGEGTQLILLNGATIDEGVLNLEFIYHEIQNILPGYPYLIKPAKDVSSTDIKVYNKVLDPNVKEMKLAFGEYQGVGTEGFSTHGALYEKNSTYYSAMLNAGDIYVSGGKLYMVSEKPVFSNGYRSYIKKTGGSSPAKAIRMSVIGGNFSEDGTATAIDIVELSDEAAETLGISKTVKGVYNLNGQKMTESVDRLPAGMYIVNGKKMYVK